MSDELDLRWRRVSEHGQPDEETCPWGYRWRDSTNLERGTGLVPRVLPHGHEGLDDHIEWQPLPPPCDEVMPPPEPEPRWTATADGEFRYVTLWAQFGQPTDDECQQAAAVLNALHEHGAVLRVRDWQEAPDDDTPVLRWDGKTWGWSTGRHVHRLRSPWAVMPPGPGPVSDG